MTPDGARLYKRVGDDSRCHEPLRERHSAGGRKVDPLDVGRLDDECFRLLQHLLAQVCAEDALSLGNFDVLSAELEHMFPKLDAGHLPDRLFPLGSGLGLVKTPSCPDTEKSLDNFVLGRRAIQVGRGQLEMCLVEQHLVEPKHGVRLCSRFL